MVFIDKIIKKHQDLLISILAPIGALTENLSEKARDVAVFIGCLLLCLYYAIYKSNLDVPFLHISNTVNHLIGSAILLVLVTFSIRSKLHRVRWNRAIYTAMTFVSIRKVLGMRCLG